MNSNKLHAKTKEKSSGFYGHEILWFHGQKNPERLLSEKLQIEGLWKSLDYRIYTKMCLLLGAIFLSHVSTCSLALKQVCIKSFSFLLFWLSYAPNPMEKSCCRTSSTENPAIGFRNQGVWSNGSLRQTQINTFQLIFEFSVIKTKVIVVPFQE